MPIWVTSEPSFIVSFYCMCVQIGNRLDNALVKSNVIFYHHCPITTTPSEDHPRVCSLHGPKHPYVHLHVSIGLVPGVTVTKYDWLRFLPRGNRFEILTTWQTCLGVPRWPHIHCFVIQVCFPLACSCRAGAFGF